MSVEKRLADYHSLVTTRVLKPGIPEGAATVTGELPTHRDGVALTGRVAPLFPRYKENKLPKNPDIAGEKIIRD